MAPTHFNFELDGAGVKRTMRIAISCSIAVVAVLAMMPGAALALDIDANIDAANSSTTNALVVDANGNATLDIVSGDTIAVVVDVSNMPMDEIAAIFVSVSYDGSQFTFLGGGFTGGILEGTCVGFLCTPPVLSPGIGSPIQKPLSPFGQATGNTDWIQALAHTNTSGTTGAGPTTALTMGFQANSNLGTTTIEFTPFIEPNSDIIAAVGGVPFPGVVNFEATTINVPEPSSIALSMASLVSVGLLAVRRRATASSL